MASWSISWQFGTVYGHLVYFMANWYIFHRFGMLHQERSGNPARYNKVFGARCQEDH
jgi:hypothetical protein